MSPPEVKCKASDRKKSIDSSGLSSDCLLEINCLAYLCTCSLIPVALFLHRSAARRRKAHPTVAKGLYTRSFFPADVSSGFEMTKVKWSATGEHKTWSVIGTGVHSSWFIRENIFPIVEGLTWGPRHPGETELFLFLVDTVTRCRPRDPTYCETWKTEYRTNFLERGQRIDSDSWALPANWPCAAFIVIFSKWGIPGWA